MSPRTGRPPSEEAKRKLLQVRLDEKTMEILDECAKERQQEVKSSEKG